MLTINTNTKLTQMSGGRLEMDTVKQNKLVKAHVEYQVKRESKTLPEFCEAKLMNPIFILKGIIQIVR